METSGDHTIRALVELETKVLNLSLSLLTLRGSRCREMTGFYLWKDGNPGLKVRLHQILVPHSRFHSTFVSNAGLEP